MVRSELPSQRLWRRSERGFTLLELIVVTAMIGILATIAIPALINMPTRAKEAVLHTNLRAIREALEQYLGDKGRYPSALSQLEPKYLRHIPPDPFTKNNTTWVLVYEDEDQEGNTEPGPPPDSGEEDQGPGIMDIHSSSTRLALDGTKYSDW